MSANQMAEDFRPAAVLAAGVDNFDAIAALGEKTALRVLELVAGMLESRALELGGTLKSSSGPTFMAEFPGALAAVQCALGLTEVLAGECEPLVRVRIGVHVGGIWFVGNEALGDGVEIARRLQSLAAPAAIAISGDVRSQIEGRVEGSLRSIGSFEVESLGCSIEAFELRPPAIRAAAPSRDRPRRAAALPAAMERLFSSLERVAAPAGSDDGQEDAAEADREAARIGAFRAHAGAFAGVSALLLVIWFVTTPFGHPWFLYPVGAWAIGLAHHFVATATRRAQRREIGARLSGEQRRTLRRIHRAEAGFAQHLTAFASVSGYLFMVNMITSPGFPWFLFPAAGWSVGLVSHRLFYEVRRKSLLERLRRLGVTRGELARTRDPLATAGRFGLLVDEAARIKESLLRQIRGTASLRSRFEADLVPLLERYVGQIGGLNERSRELEGLLSTLSETQIDAEIEKLQAGREAARSPSVRAEYDRALGQHRQQRESLQELRGQQEILDLRIKGSVLALKRIEMDVARMKGIGTSDVLESLKDKSDELSRYLEDLKAGYSELDA